MADDEHERRWAKALLTEDQRIIWEKARIKRNRRMELLRIFLMILFFIAFAGVIYVCGQIGFKITAVLQEKGIIANPLFPPREK